MVADHKPTISPRTLYEMRTEMRSLTHGDDAEVEHSTADAILVEALRYLASLLPPHDHSLWPSEVEDLIESWQAVKKWYA